MSPAENPCPARIPAIVAPGGIVSRVSRKAGAGAIAGTVVRADGGVEGGLRFETRT